ncbi:MAG TPA: HWE histidine kinase domain-containing protein [Xanthobacteraceae bacterium]|nr:HWE histidine kinase domain-containing protein [Xanthobacteraceae bacterium]
MAAAWDALKEIAFGSPRIFDIAVALVAFALTAGIIWLFARRRNARHIHSLETEQQRLTEELATAWQRCEIALRGSNVTVFTQDRELRYTSISNPFLGFKVDEIVGRSDTDLIPARNREAVINLKREALATGQPVDRELQIDEGRIPHWFDFHIEPLRGRQQEVTGLTCTAVDVTVRKENEEHLRLLMRELTHRSKNLLAIIQALARQTARYAGSIDEFLNQFTARVQALSRSHDLLVQEDWHGAELSDLLRSQIEPYLDQEKTQASWSGPPVRLRPEAAQSLGLALHELASNAARHGALKGPDGRVSVRWDTIPERDDAGVEIIWTEQGGPAVATRKKLGFGSLVIERNLPRSLESDVELRFIPEGVRCRIRIPGKYLFSAPAPVS